MLENHTDQREMVLPFFITFFNIVARSEAITGDFSSVPDYSMTSSKKTSCVTPRIYRFCFAGTSASAYRMGSSKASELVWKPAQFKCFEHVVERTFGLQRKHSILFARLLLLLSSSFDTQMHATKDLHFNVFQVKRDAIKSNLSSACLPTGIYWLTTLGL